MKFNIKIEHFIYFACVILGFDYMQAKQLFHQFSLVKITNCITVTYNEVLMLLSQSQQVFFTVGHH